MKRLGVRKIKAGDTFGEIKITNAYEVVGSKRHWYHRCLCTCGVEELLSAPTIIKRSAFGCQHSQMIRCGDVFGRLTVVAKEAGSGESRYRCLCSCGNEKIVSGVLLKTGGVKSCGCLKIDAAKKSHTIHGYEGTRLYKTWRNIKTRCLNPKATRYKYYGGKGVEICKAWLDFVPFKDWALANGYEDHLSIDRIDNDGNYCPENCCWISMSENIRKQWRDRRAKRARSLAAKE